LALGEIPWKKVFQAITSMKYILYQIFILYQENLSLYPIFNSLTPLQYPPPKTVSSPIGTLPVHGYAKCDKLLIWYLIVSHQVVTETWQLYNT
jgi:hypothetical protein